jgi:hypothetical protein
VSELRAQQGMIDHLGDISAGEGHGVLRVGM